MEAHRKHVVKMSAWLALMILVTGCSIPQHFRASSQTVGELADPLEAFVALQRSAEKSGGTKSCTNQRVHVATFSISGTKIQITCRDGSQQILHYREAPEAEAMSDVNSFGRVELYGKDGTAHRVVNTIYWSKFESAKEFANAWYVLAQPRKLPDPATDSVFLDAVKRYRAEPQTHAETLRRVQIQVENAIKEHRTIEAATLYHDMLKTAAGWPEGHFNLALIYGDLEVYAEAITEMKRYLYLAPNAPDVRAAQDKIYEWELKAK